MSDATSASQIYTVRIGGSHRRARTTDSRWALQQWPKLAPDALHLAYCSGESLDIIDLKAQTSTFAAAECPIRFGWISPSFLLVLIDGELTRVAADGATEYIADDVAEFAIAGTPS